MEYTKSKYFRSLDYHDRQAALVSLGLGLEKAGWTIYGYHKGSFSPLDDYSQPPSWSGIAQKDGFVLVADNFRPTHSGFEEKLHGVAGEVTCSSCSGNGLDLDPEAWTIDMAKEHPYPFAVFSLLEQNPGSKQIVGETVPTVELNGKRITAENFQQVDESLFLNGKMKCQKCLGTGKVSKLVTVWPTYQANPARKSWHLEKDGKIIVDGVSLAKMAMSYWEGSSMTKRAAVDNAVSDFVTMLESHLKPIQNIPTSAPQQSAEIEIVEYSEKAIVVRGKTYHIREKLAGAGGKFNKFLKNPDGSRFAGWIFSKKHFATVNQLIHE